MQETKQLIIDNVKKLNQLEKDCIKFSYESKKPKDGKEAENYLLELFRISGQAFDTSIKILSDLSKIDNLTIRDKQEKEIVYGTIKKIKENKLYSISCYKSISEMVNKFIKNENEKIKTSITEEMFERFFEERFSDFHSWFDLDGFYNKKVEVSAIISSSYLPHYIKDYFNEIKDTYAFRCYKSSVVFCRSLLEACLYDVLTKKGILTKKNYKIMYSINDKRKEKKEDKLCVYINIAMGADIIDIKRKALADYIRRTANRVLHLKNRGSDLNEEEAFKIISDTISLIECLYK